MTVYARRTERWEGLLVDTGYRTVVLYSTLAGQDDRSRLGVVPGTELARVEQLYGPATHRVNGRGELYLRYDSPYIVFRVDEGGHVEGWMIYAIK
jgi:hypothetical protein